MNPRTLILCWVSLIVLYADVADSGRGGRGSSRSGKRYGSLSRGSSSFSRHRSFRPRISSSRSRYLFPTVGALAGIYIASQMRPRVRLRSYDDFDRVTVCPGFRMGFDPQTGVRRNYSYFVCPDDPDALWNKYCCMDETTSNGFCCRSERHGTVSYASGFGSFAAVVAIAVLIYCCCCRRRAQQKQSSVDNSPITANQPFDHDYNSPYPVGPTTQTFPTPQPVPYPDANFVPPQPPPPIPPPAMGSAWATNSMGLKPPNDVPPPPYPGNEPAPPYTLHASAPYPPNPSV